MAILPLTPPRMAGLLYLLIIICGLWAEGYVRGTLVLPADAEATARNLVQSEALFRMGLLADTIMALADVAVGVLLFGLLAPLGQGLALAALAMRLVQAAIIASALPGLHSALGLARSDPARALAAIQNHGFSYDMGLVFFGVCCLLTGALLMRAGARILAVAIILAGLVYLTGSGLRIAAPAAVAAFQPAYLICILAELGFALWLLLGRKPQELAARVTP
ncbi:DUF4386 domain-containing protein [Seohaeicola saemankumensis]|jgi:hypothetical protein|uniref:DUF4386 domain-containing protein n=1 Tax=Seohaeicola TaxID=481178 RepID=UPI0007F44CCB|nr:DUF4386 domain-containing protein [Paracoccaceae bacterium]OAN68658.1 hypothetical protein A8B83_17690 [Rhodobacteraceae bacterium EhC02]